MRPSPIVLALLLLAPAAPAGAQDPALRMFDLGADAPTPDLDVPLRAGLAGPPPAADWALEASYTPLHGTVAANWTVASGSANLPDGTAAWSLFAPGRFGAGHYEFTLRLEAGGRAAEATLAVDVPERRNDTVALPLVLADAPGNATVNGTVNGTANATANGAVNGTASSTANATVAATNGTGGPALTMLRFSSDTVNADGKTKTPGTALVTRVLAADGDGIGDVARVAFAYYRNLSGQRVLAARHVVEAPGAGSANGTTEKLLEDRFDDSPLEDGAYAEVVTAEGTGNASVERSFTILDVATEAALAMQAAARPVADLRLPVDLAVSDRNFGAGSLAAWDAHGLPLLHLALYRGSARVADAGWNVTLADGSAAADLDLRAEGTRSTRFASEASNGTGRLHVPLAVMVPEGAAPGTYRLSVASSTTLASASFDVQPVPRLVALWANGTGEPGSSLAVEGIASGLDGVQGARLRLPWGDVELPAQPDPLGARVAAQVALPVPWAAEGGNASLLLRLDGDRAVHDASGAVVNAMSVPLPGANVSPRVRAVLALAGRELGGEAWVAPRAAGELALRVAAEDDNGGPGSGEVAALQVEVRDWAGRAAAWGGTGNVSPDAGSLALRPPTDAPPGAYEVTVRAVDRHGAAAEQRLALHVGTHFRLRVREAQARLAVDGTRLDAPLHVRAAGNAPARGLAVRVAGLPDGTAVAALLLPNGSLLRQPMVAGEARFEGAPLLAAGEEAQLDVRAALPMGAPPEATLVVAGEAG